MIDVRLHPGSYIKGIRPTTFQCEDVRLHHISHKSIVACLFPVPVDKRRLILTEKDVRHYLDLFAAFVAELSVC